VLVQTSESDWQWWIPQACHFPFAIHYEAVMFYSTSHWLRKVCTGQFYLFLADVCHRHAFHRKYLKHLDENWPIITGDLWIRHLWFKVAGGKGISETKSKQQSSCSNCMHWPVMPCDNACSTCLHWLVTCMHRPAISYRLMHALTACDFKFQVCLRCTFTPATLSIIEETYIL
jgi:hypothetical protein